MNIDVAAVAVPESHRKQLSDSSLKLAHKDSVKELLAVLPKGHTLSAGHEESAKSSRDHCVSGQLIKQRDGRVYAKVMPSRAKIAKACLRTLDV
jgi:hypothetical protein